MTRPPPMTATQSDHQIASTHFGFEQCPARGEARISVDDVFRKVADRYDHHERPDVRRASPPLEGPARRHGQPAQARSHFDHLDVAGGTGDVAFRVAKAGGGPYLRYRPRHQCGHAGSGKNSGRAKARACIDRLNVRRGQRRGPAAAGMGASTPTRSPSASATSPGSTSPSPKPIACPAARRPFPVPGVLRRWICRASIALYDAYSFNVIPKHRPGGDGRWRELPLSGRIDPPVSRMRRKLRGARSSAAGFRNTTFRPD